MFLIMKSVSAHFGNLGKYRKGLIRAVTPNSTTQTKLWLTSWGCFFSYDFYLDEIMEFEVQIFSLNIMS